MALLNPWVGYIDRSYEQIKAALLQRLGLSNPEITDHSESNILIIILGIFAGIAEMLGYYIDNMAREAFLETARRYTSVVKIAKQLDYRVKAINPAGVTISFTLLDSNNDPINLATATTIPVGTIVSTGNGTKFYTNAPLIILPGQYQGSVGAVQVDKVSAQTLGISDGTPNQSFLIGTGSGYVHDSLGISLGVDVWELVPSFGYTDPNDKAYVVNIHEDGKAYVEFGDDTFGKIPPNGQAITADYLTSIGAGANTILANTITLLVTPLVLPGVSRIEITNPIVPTGGRDYEDIESIRFRAPLSIRTLERAVTYQDYLDVAVMANGVAQAAIDYCCGSCITIYVLPEGGGLASLGLLNAVKDYICDKKIITTCINIKAAGITVIPISIEVTGTFRQDPALILADVTNALLNWGSIDNQKINKAVRLSDIYSVVDNLDRVDFSNITYIGTIPYARPQGTNPNELSWIRETLVTSTTKNKYRLEYNGFGNFALSLNGNYIQNVTLGSNYIDTNIAFQITPGVYALGNVWEFTSYGANKDIPIDDYTVPTTQAISLNITINGVTTNLNCKPTCND